MYRRYHTRTQTIQVVVLSTFTILTSVFLLTAMMAAAVHHDCRVPPQRVSVTGALIMEYACPESLARAEMNELVNRNVPPLR